VFTTSKEKWHRRLFRVRLSLSLPLYFVVFPPLRCAALRAN